MLKWAKKILGEIGKMKLNKKVFEDSIAVKWKRGCPMCGGNQWSYDEDLISTPIQVEENLNLTLGGKILPLVAVCCDNCGNTILVNAKKIDALDGLNDIEENKNADTE